mmetsp:Transcript_30580/g.88843  ORF Transcript_30580/g.88843 Transcript_30580/m.88843 type:complete len:210 (-) Transcript_30580:847-1476(-)
MAKAHDIAVLEDMGRCTASKRSDVFAMAFLLGHWKVRAVALDGVALENGEGLDGVDKVEFPAEGERHPVLAIRRVRPHGDSSVAWWVESQYFACGHIHHKVAKDCFHRCASTPLLILRAPFLLSGNHLHGKEWPPRGKLEKPRILSFGYEVRVFARTCFVQVHHPGKYRRGCGQELRVSPPHTQQPCRRNSSSSRLSEHSLMVTSGGDT